jgi:hypothetical protein
MGLWNWIVTQTTGIDPAAEQQRSDTADAATAQLDQQALESGTWTQAQYDAAMADIGTGNASTGAGDVMGSIDSEAVAGLKEGLNNVLTAPGKVVGAVGSGASTLLWGIIKSIPWWVYLGAAVALFIWMGGLELIQGRLKKYK